MPLVICITEGIPVIDMVRVTATIESKNAPDRPQLPRRNLVPANAKSASCRPHPQARARRRRQPQRHSYLRSSRPTNRTRHRPSTCIGIGGDPIIGTSFLEAITLFNDDPDTHAIILIGESEATPKSPPPNISTPT